MKLRLINTTGQRHRILLINIQAHMKIPSYLDPFTTLNVASNASQGAVKNAFRSQICSPMRHIRATVALAYDMICSKDPQKYSRHGNMFHVQKKDIFYYVNMRDYDVLVTYIKKYPNVLDMRDEHERTLLYLAARNGFNNICDFLLRCGCNINQVQVDGSTALHAAAFYGHLTVVQLLLEYGVNASIRNNFGHVAIDEAFTTQIQDCIRTKSIDQINVLLNQLKSKGLAKHIVMIEHSGRIIAKKILRNPQCFSEYSLSYLEKKWILAWHGTKYAYLPSIMQHGLQAAGTFISPEY